MDILLKDESSCFLKRMVQLNIKLKTSLNISNLTLKNLTLNPYAMHKFTMKETHLLGHFMSFLKHMPTYVRALYVYRRSKDCLSRA
jgi:hypothetical protein